ncbi:pyruvate formate lyase family protein [Caproiciproducens sp. CPB-2]|uniref:pyruvate formate lyase family protein n=1 Tax=Caproiciproducens sp. CPB-2 TaxID=3030017 RepID=UPI0023DA30C2|nr:pyruvate formate lyase family protein [Caproiciproducens sp. CPB-2]MDF1493159.1 pyruvate formate lyase family protein [Caproiciproducens sp. CPB-2]
MNDKSVAETVEISKKIECEKPLEEQIQIMEEYTECHRVHSECSVSRREVECLKVLYPRLFRHIEDQDLVVGRLDALPIGFGCVTSVGGVGHYCVFSKLAKLRQKAAGTPELVERLNALEAYWDNHDTRSIFFNDSLTETTMGKFVDAKYPAILTARLSGMYLDYPKLIDLGIPGLEALITGCLEKEQEADKVDFYKNLLECLQLLKTTILYHVNLCKKQLMQTAGTTRKKQLENIMEALGNILKRKPETLLEGIELSWLYSLLSSVVNYGRMDDYLGELLVHDLQAGLYDERQALAYIKSFFKLIEARRSNVNGRVVIGGKGRRNPETADVFCKIAIQAVMANKDIEPQFTLRIYSGMNPEIYELALQAIATGCTYPVLYNDDVNIPSVERALRVSHETALQYVPFGCGEIVISGQSVGTPNACINLLKILNISLNGGIDPWDGKDKSGGLALETPDRMKTFDDVRSQYERLLEYYIVQTAGAHRHSYEVMKSQVSFLFTSMLVDDCIARGRAVLNGGARYLGGTNETYGNINASDSLTAIKYWVYDKKKYTLSRVVEAMNDNFEHDPELRRDLVNAPKYGNDDPYADDIAVALHQFTCGKIEEQAKAFGFYSYNAVVINNQVNTEWGRATSASADGRLKGVYMNNGNNPQGGADKNGPTAMLNSLVRLKTDIHAGSVQNMKFNRYMCQTQGEKVKALLRTYFKNGGGQIMISVVSRGELEDAYQNPEKYPNLLVRVGGFSARFVELEKDVQREVISRTLN